MAGPGAFISGCAGPHLTSGEAAFFKDAQPWGFILFARNIEDAAQLRRLCGDLRASLGRDAPILIDQEGGRVQRLRPPLARAWHPPLTQVQQAGPEAAARSMYLRYALIGAELRGFGIDTNCAPMLDVARKATHPFLRNRCYGFEPAPVAEIGRAVATGLLAAGVLPVMKHIPGHGRGQVDSHKELPVVGAGPDELSAVDFAPFRALADLPLAMTGHLVYSALDTQAATVSARMIALIRQEIGFAGLLMTDDINMEALGGTSAERARAAISAGCDLVLHCNGALDEMQAVATEAGHLPAEAELRGQNALALRAAAGSIDIAGAEAELEALLKGQVYDTE
ncbi:MAG: glycoside hydrolase family 3 protein [Rhodobacteraceae bacterium]|nr:glycoside hydrolase family 3 protein [Paracoccaceae bacterium]